MIRLRQSDPYDGPLRDLTPDLTPMLDILFILLVFFMITAGAVFQSFDLKLPSAVAENSSLFNNPRHIVLEIHADRYTVNGDRISDFASLKGAVSQAVRKNPEHELVIAGDERVTIERLLKVLVYLQSQGIKAANILMRNENTQ